MPLPRFHRLPADEQRRILDIALKAFAEQGTDAASYNQIIAAAGISRSSAYNYFDGREDLLDAVLDEVAERFGAALGTWPTAADPDAFWAELERSTDNITVHIEQHPADLALIDAAFYDRSRGRFVGWVEDLIANGADIGVITIPIDRSLLVGITTAALPAFDSWAIERLRSGGQMPAFGELRTVLSHLWGTPS
ncbi:TetR/AcrR family transcriptional regulator [Solicola gregarius]|uniref:TetR/AcrR family transcriptional regulator n=1 Tax=Solicola gregarius TaxID=2908642 RepID=A0AA46YJD3_9ACTN|nr:TetR/AcrR family transcriptional regulator [Solicola gregarius]UYM03434.1 TetR/AcrR family transcriptional regulator [Solicola gregarius]